VVDLTLSPPVAPPGMRYSPSREPPFPSLPVRGSSPKQESEVSLKTPSLGSPFKLPKQPDLSIQGTSLSVHFSSTIGDFIQELFFLQSRLSRESFSLGYTRRSLTFLPSRAHPFLIETLTHFPLARGRAPHSLSKGGPVLRAFPPLPFSVTPQEYMVGQASRFWSTPLLCTSFWVASFLVFGSNDTHRTFFVAPDSLERK